MKSNLLNGQFEFSNAQYIEILNKVKLFCPLTELEHNQLQNYRSVLSDFIIRENADSLLFWTYHYLNGEVDFYFFRKQLLDVSDQNKNILKLKYEKGDNNYFHLKQINLNYNGIINKFSRSAKKVFNTCYSLEYAKIEESEFKDILFEQFLELFENFNYN